MDSSFEFRMKSIADVPLVELDSNRSRQGPSAENPVGYEESKLPRFYAVMVAAEPLKDSLLRNGIVSYVIALQGAGAILVFQTADRLPVFCFLCGWKPS